MKTFSSSLLCLFLVFTVLSCKDKEPVPAQQALVNPGDANALSAVLIMPSGAQTRSGSAPAPTGNASAPQVAGSNSSVVASNGSTTPLGFTYSNIGGNLGGCYAQIAGADTYFNLAYTGQSGTQGALSLPLGIPANVDEGSFTLNFSVYDTQGRVSNRESVTVNVLRLGTGALQVSLSWNTPTDQDLYVTDPGGNTIYWQNTSSPTGGELDRDDIDGFGPENIFWEQDALDGTYTISVNDYARTASPNTCYVTINAPGKSKSFTVTTQNGQMVEVVKLTKSGSNYNF
jgi:hypothetical protein